MNFVSTLDFDLIIGSNRRWRRQAIKIRSPQCWVYSGDGVIILSNKCRLLGTRERPRPRVDEPEMGQDMKSCGVWPTVVCGDTDEDRFCIIFILSILKSRQE